MENNIAMCLELMKRKMPLDDIQNLMGLDDATFNSILREIRARFNVVRKIYSDGDIYYKVYKHPKEAPKNEIRINLHSNKFHIVFLADPHIGSKFERIDLLEKIYYEYGKKHNVHIFVNGGDMIEGIYPTNKKKVVETTGAEQVEKVVSVYPHLPGAYTLVTYGNHDQNAEGIDTASYIEDRRYDLISVGYNMSILNIANDSIGVVHNLSMGKIYHMVEQAMIFKAHGHKSRNIQNRIFYLPASSEEHLGNYEYEPLPGFIDTVLTIEKGKIKRADLTLFAFADGKIRLANEQSIRVDEEREKKLILSKKNENVNI